ncbi:MAG: DNA-directed RNA polymerase subunit alpha, partial [Blautia sp.]|nr:DNA-directed RNA polymerase subunit alpha [Blautia sp.]
GSDILQTDVSVLQLTIRTWNILNRNGIHTLGEFISILAEDKEGLGIRIGRNSLSEVVCKLEELGLLSDC